MLLCPEQRYTSPKPTFASDAIVAFGQPLHVADTL